MHKQLPRIAFIGLGNMGAPMALNLLKAGYAVCVFDLVQATMDNLKQAGAKSVNSALEVVQDVDVVISMLPAGKHVESLYISENGLVSQLKAGTLVIDSSTIDASTSKAVACKLAEKSIHFIDAPLTLVTI